MPRKNGKGSKIVFQDAMLELRCVEGSVTHQVLLDFLADEFRRWDIWSGCRGLPVPITTDRGGNIAKACYECSDLVWLPCFSHIM